MVNVQKVLGPLHDRKFMRHTGCYLLGRETEQEFTYSQRLLIIIKAVCPLIKALCPLIKALCFPP